MSAEGRSGESMLEIIRARAMPYFSHVLSEKKLLMLKKYIVAETESNLMAIEINSARSAIYIRTIVHSKYTHHYDE